jgi:hypothetical protein
VGAGFAAWTKVRSGDNDPVTKICGSVPRVKIVKKIQRAPGFYFGFTQISAITNYQLSIFKISKFQNFTIKS